MNYFAGGNGAVMRYKTNITRFVGSMHANGKVFRNQPIPPESWLGGFVPQNCCSKG